MNRQELQTYLRHCLERHSSEFYAVEGGANWQESYWRHIALGHAHLLVAKRGIGASLLAREAEAINREWESETLATRVQEAIRFVVDLHYDVAPYLGAGVEAAVLANRNPTEADAEQAIACRMLAQAASSFRKAKRYGVDEARLDQLIAQCNDLGSVPAPQGGKAPLQNVILAALTYLREKKSLENADSGGQSTGASIFEDLVFPPSAWAENLNSIGKLGNSHQDEGGVLERLRLALQELPHQIEDAHLARQQRLKALFDEPKSAMSESQDEDPVPTLRLSSEIPSEEQASSPNRKIVERPQQSAHLAGAGVARSMTFVEVGDMLCTKKQQDKSWDEKTAKQAKALYALFSKFLAEEHGVTTFIELKQPHLYAYDQFMRMLHADYGRSPSDKARSIAQLREMSRHKLPAKQGLSVLTRNRHLTQLGTLLDEAESLGEPLDRGLNLTRLRGKKQGRARDDRMKLSESQVDTFFRSPVFMGCKSWKKLHESGDQVFHRAAYFGPLLAYYQGMRREEYCGLHVNDVVSDNGSHPYLHVAANDFRRLKNAQSRRNLVLHPELIRLGFIEYVSIIAKTGHERVFPDLYSPGTTSLLGDRLYREMEPLRKALGITPHQFRHFFNDELKQQRVTQEFRADLMGHGGDSETSERYCNPVKLELQMEELLKLPVRTAHINRMPIQLIPWVALRQIPPWSRARFSSSKT